MTHDMLAEVGDYELRVALILDWLPRLKGAVCSILTKAGEEMDYSCLTQEQ